MAEAIIDVFEEVDVDDREFSLYTRTQRAAFGIVLSKRGRHAPQPSPNFFEG